MFETFTKLIGANKNNLLFLNQFQFDFSYTESITQRKMDFEKRNRLLLPGHITFWIGGKAYVREFFRSLILCVRSLEAQVQFSGYPANPGEG
jgi:hypothetical protein